MKQINLLITILATCLFCSCQKGKEANSSFIPVKTEDRWFFINQRGETVIEPTQMVYKASFFYDGVSLVEIADATSQTLPNPLTFINTKGEFITDNKYKYATIFNEGIAWVVNENGYPAAINKKGETLFSLKTCEKAGIFTEGLAPVCFTEDGIQTWGYVNSEGKNAIPPTFVKCSGFKSGLAPAVKDEAIGWGYIDKKGEFIIQPQFSEANCFRENGLAVVGIGDRDTKYGIIDKKGKYVVSPQYDAIISDGEIYIVKVSDVYGWMTKDGKMLISPQFKMITPFGKSEVTGVTIDNKKYGLIDKKGKYVVNPQFDRITSFIGDIAPFQMGGKLGFIDKKGKIVINPQYMEIQYDYMYDYMGSFAYDYMGSEDSYAVKTDYFDVESVTSNLLKNSGLGSFREISNHTTFKQVSEMYQDLYYDSPYSRRSNESIDLGNGVSISQTIFRFPEELSKSSYNYYDGKYETVEANDAKVESIRYTLTINQYSKARNKGKNIAQEVAKAIKSTCNMSEATDTNIAREAIEINLKSAEMDITVAGSESRITITVSFEK
ncbi:MAG: WG repeat-containing protein [Dysgonomonas sp.]